MPWELSAGIEVHPEDFKNDVCDTLLSPLARQTYGLNSLTMSLWMIVYDNTESKPYRRLHP